MSFQIGYRKGTLTEENILKLQKGQNFEFLGNTNDFLLIPADNPTQASDIGFAIESLKNGYLVRRQSWPEGAYLALSSGQKSSHFTYAGVGTEGSCIVKKTSDKPYICMFFSDTEYQPGYSPTPEDLLADNWQLVEPKY